ncbi:type II toxin-antitoxin system PemK/MazF family toxin [Cohnella herbarum]|uniref:Toxin MazF n=1 Tax=Cohnella herbarum TaxID=2728023 RepID=A0A7Z2VMP2_9BACL|nr:type II toxin-antitoxin system PemK/MazF family toxin [Cohnella herbarum]QJD86126.1 toxin MazF [Cohnella herbarum]
MSITGTVERGSIVWMNFEPQAGHEQSLWRAALILSDGLIHPTVAPVAVVVPITNQAKGLPFETPVPAGIPINGALIGKPNLIQLTGVALPFQEKAIDLGARDATVIGKIDRTHPFYRAVEQKVIAIIIG